MTKYSIPPQIYIWGTGKNADEFMRKYSIYKDSSIRLVNIVWEQNVVGFIDSNAAVQGGEYEGKKIVSPDQAYADGMDYCIITVTANDAIIKQLQSYGYSEEQWIYWKDYLEQYKQEILKDRAEILRNSEDPVDQLVRYLLFSREADSISLKTAKQNFISEYSSEYPYEWISALAWYCGNELDKAASLWCESRHLTNTVHRIVMRDGTEKTACMQEPEQRVQTIGLLVDRYYGGGIEKVVSILLEKFSKRSYRIILMTDDISERDYELPEGVIRYSLKEPYYGRMEERLKQMERCIRKYQMDILCFHVGYARTEGYYELLLSKLLGVSTVMVLHSALPAVISDHKDIAPMLPHVYRMADEMVAVAHRDQEALEALGCSCSYIPNPIETFGIQTRTELLRKDTYQLLWVGRIVQHAKQVLDTVEIMKHVSAKLSNVTMKIIGGRDAPQVYERLMARIREEGLEESIEIAPYQKDMSEIYKESDLVLITSSTESFSNVLAEAKVCSRPVVMYELPWLSLVQDGRGIIQVRQNDTSGASDAILRLLSDRELLEQYSFDAWESIQPFLRHDIIKNWEAVFEKIMKRNSE